MYGRIRKVTVIFLRFCFRGIVNLLNGFFYWLEPSSEDFIVRLDQRVTLGKRES